MTSGTLPNKVTWTVESHSGPYYLIYMTEVMMGKKSHGELMQRYDGIHQGLKATWPVLLGLVGKAFRY